MTGAKILVADDSLTIQKVIKLALANEGYEIHTTSDGEETLQQLSLFRPDVVLIDVSLKGKSAFEVKREADQKSDLSNIKFVLLSSAFKQVDQQKVNDHKFSSILVKPFDPSHLRQLLQSATEHLKPKPTGNDLSDLLDTSEDLPPSFDEMNEEEDAYLHREFDLPLQPENNATLPSSFSMPPSRPQPQPKTDNAHKFLASTIEAAQDSTPHNYAVDPSLDLPFEPTEHLPKKSPRPPTTTSIQNELPSDLGTTSPKSFSRSHDEIQFLTNTTLGTEPIPEFEWSVQEPKNTKNVGSPHHSSPPSFSPPSPFNAPVSEEPNTRPNVRYQPPISNHKNSALDGSDPGHSRDATVYTLRSEEIDELIKQHVETSMAKLTKRLLPDIAERIVREEIHKLLMDPP